MTPLSPKRQQLLDFIRRFRQQRGYGPTVREILQARHVSSISLVQRDLKVLEKEGYISRDPGIRRSITLTDRAGEADRGAPPGLHRRRPAHPGASVRGLARGAAGDAGASGRHGFRQETTSTP